jgi:hypothetical protein
MTTDTPETGASQRPQVIDLEAEEFRSAGQDAEAPESRASGIDAAAPRHRRGWPLGVIAALIVGVLAGMWLYRDLLASYLPSNEMTALSRQIAALQQNNADLAAELAGIKQQATAAAEAAASADARAATASTTSEGLAGKMDTTDQRLAEAESQLAAVQAKLETLGTSLKNIPTTAGAGAVDGAALAALSARIDALEADVAKLTPAGGATQADQTAALSQALSDLKAKIAAGTAYQAEYDRIARLEPAAAGLDVLAGHAASGIPDAKGLAAALRALIPGLPKQAPAAMELDGYAGWLLDSLSDVITIRPIGETDWPRLAEKAAAFAEAGDLTEAIAALDAGQGEWPAGLRQWQEQAAARLQLEQATAQLSEAILRKLGATGSSAQ